MNHHAQSIIKRLLPSVIATLTVPATAIANSASFHGLGDLPGGTFSSVAFDVSAAGTVVVGSSYSGLGLEAFRWTKTAGMEPLGDLPGGEFRSYATAVSPDGSIIAGCSKSDRGEEPHTEAFEWAEATGMVGLGFIMGGEPFSCASDAANDGAVLGNGREAGGGKVGFRYAAGLMNSTLLLDSRINTISAATNGGSFVGNGVESAVENFRQAYIHRGLIHFLGDLPGGIEESRAHDVSDDGSVVVGTSGSAAAGWSLEAFRWEDGVGMTGLGALSHPGCQFYSEATGVSGDGATAVGVSLGPTCNKEAVIWRKGSTQPESLRDVLVNDFGVAAELAGWELNFASKISKDGYTIVGYGTNPDGESEAFRAHIGPGLAEPPGDDWPRRQTPRR